MEIPRPECKNNEKTRQYLNVVSQCFKIILRPGIAAGAAALLLCAGWLSPGEAKAQAYPTKPLRMIQSLGAGGGADPLARLMAQKLAESLGQPVVVETQAGAGGAIGANMVARAPADGYTVGFAAASGLVLRSFEISERITRTAKLEPE